MKWDSSEINIEPACSDDQRRWEDKYFQSSVTWLCHLIQTHEYAVLCPLARPPSPPPQSSSVAAIHISSRPDPVLLCQINTQPWWWFQDIFHQKSTLLACLVLSYHEVEEICRTRPCNLWKLKFSIMLPLSISCKWLIAQSLFMSQSEDGHHRHLLVSWHDCSQGTLLFWVTFWIQTKFSKDSVLNHNVQLCLKPSASNIMLKVLHTYA